DVIERATSVQEKDLPLSLHQVCAFTTPDDDGCEFPYPFLLRVTGRDREGNISTRKRTFTITTPEPISSVENLPPMYHPITTRKISTRRKINSPGIDGNHPLLIYEDSCEFLQRTKQVQGPNRVLSLLLENPSINQPQSPPAPGSIGAYGYCCPAKNVGHQDTFSFECQE
ncbi:hypothetical protein AVEN_150421-1, partial [Araneus ventricosus]